MHLAAKFAPSLSVAVGSRRIAASQLVAALLLARADVDAQALSCPATDPTRRDARSMREHSFRVEEDSRVYVVARATPAHLAARRLVSPPPKMPLVTAEMVKPVRLLLEARADVAIQDRVMISVSVSYVVISNHVHTPIISYSISLAHAQTREHEHNSGV